MRIKANGSTLKASDATTDPTTGEVRTRKLAQFASIGAGARVAKN